MVEGISGVQTGPGATALTSDSFVGKQLREVAGEILDCSLGSGIGQQVRVRAVGIDRGRIDDGAAPAACLRRRRFDEIKHRRDVDREGQAVAIAMSEIRPIEERKPTT